MRYVEFDAEKVVVYVLLQVIAEVASDVGEDEHDKKEPRKYTVDGYAPLEWLELAGEVQSRAGLELGADVGKNAAETQLADVENGQDKKRTNEFGDREKSVESAVRLALFEKKYLHANVVKKRSWDENQNQVVPKKSPSRRTEGFFSNVHELETN